MRAKRRKRSRNQFNRNILISNDNSIIQGYAKCSVEKNLSLTVNFYLEWNSTLNESIQDVLHEYVIYMASSEGRLVITSQLRDINICAISAKPLKLIDPVLLSASSQFSQTYDGPYSILNLVQLEAHETYVESLTTEYTSFVSIFAKCSVIAQELDSNDTNQGLERALYPIIQINYILTWWIEMRSQ